MLWFRKFDGRSPDSGSTATDVAFALCLGLVALVVLALVAFAVLGYALS